MYVAIWQACNTCTGHALFPLHELLAYHVKLYCYSTLGSQCMQWTTATQFSVQIVPYKCNVPFMLRNLLLHSSSIYSKPTTHLPKCNILLFTFWWSQAIPRLHSKVRLSLFQSCGSEKPGVSLVLLLTVHSVAWSAPTTSCMGFNSIAGYPPLIIFLVALTIPWYPFLLLRILVPRATCLS